MFIGVRAVVAIAICKALRFCSRLLHRGGTAMPGKVALKICPDLLARLSGSVDTIAVTGTNGKTTCSRMIEETMADKGLDYFANRSGANLISGITTEFVMNASLSGVMRRKYAVIECDEAAAKTVFGQLCPHIIVVTNLFRDQLDRYGEITHTLSNIREGIRSVPNAILCLNADCSLTASLADNGFPNRVVWFGIDKEAGNPSTTVILSDASHCIRCKHEYQYHYRTYAHLGGFYCPQCGYSRPHADFSVQSILNMTDQNSEVTVRTPHGNTNLNVNLPATYNLYNAVAALSACTTAGIAPHICIRALSHFSCGFGRMERFPLGAKGCRMILIKNPAGASQALEYLSHISDEFILVACLNDRNADGTDVSWIWDADFSVLQRLEKQIKRIFISGDRAFDLQLRFKYAGISETCMQVEQNINLLVSLLEKATLPIYIIPTYTAMLDMRQVIVQRVGGKEFWE